MSATTPAETAAPPSGDAGDQCAFCHAPLEADQEWCLDCGAGRTIVRRPPDWRVPVAVIGLVVLAGLVALAIALIDLSGTGTGTSTGAGAAAPATLAAAKTARPRPVIASWPAGLSGWTVVLADTRGRAAATAIAAHLAAGGLSVGVLATSDHPLMRPSRRWIVFSHRYPSEADAQAAAARLIAGGHPGATAREVAGSGGI